MSTHEKNKAIASLLQKCAASAQDSNVRKTFAAAIQIPILQEVRDASQARVIFTPEQLPPGAQAAYPIADDFDGSVFVLPSFGEVPRNHVEPVGEEIIVRPFTISTSFDWPLRYALQGRIDIAQRAMRNAARAIVDYEEEAAWRVLMAAATTDFPGKGLLPARDAAIEQIASGSSAGFLSKELVNGMMTRMKRNRRTMTHLYVSPEDMADIRNYSESQVDEITRREIFVGAGLSSMWGVQFVETHKLGATGIYNINGSASTGGIFQAGAGEAFNDYTLTNPNVVDANLSVVTPGETQVLGLDLSSNDSFVMPIEEEFQVWDDSHNLHREQKQGFYGWERVGFAVLDSRPIVLGVIDRTAP